MPQTITDQKLRFSLPIIGASFIIAKAQEIKKDEENKNIIYGFVSMELSKRDFDICPASAFNIDQYLKTNPQVWYNHSLWKDDNGNEIPIGKCLELYSARVYSGNAGQITSGNDYDALLVVDEKTQGIIGTVSKERAEALNIKNGDSGLWSKIRIDVPKVWEMIEDGRLNAFSWQGKADISEVWSMEHNKLVRQCNTIDLMEISVVPLPANERATFAIAKSFVGKLAENNLIKNQPSPDYGITEKHNDGHYHIYEYEMIDGYSLGRTILTAKGVDHPHAINCRKDCTVSGISSGYGEDHFHNLLFTEAKNFKKSYGVGRIQKFRDFPIAPKEIKIEKSVIDEINKNNLELASNIHAFFHVSYSMGKDMKEERKLDIRFPIAAEIDGKICAVWSLVKDSLRELVSGIHNDLTAEEYKSLAKHLSCYYKKFGEKIPSVFKF